VAIAAGAAIATALGGCSLLVSTNGLTTVGDAAPTDTTDARGAPDSSAGDAPTAEAAADAGDAADANTGPFCASLNPKPKFCADFDKGSVSDYGSLFGTPTLDLSISKSAPASLLSIVETSAMVRGSSVETTFPDAPTSIAISVDIFVDEYDIAHDVELVTANFASTGNVFCDVNIAVRMNAWTIGEYCETNGTANGVGANHRTSATLQLAKWTHVDATVDLSPGGAMHMAVDGTAAFDGTGEPGFVTGKTGIVMGIPYLQPMATSRSKVHTDNLTYDYH